MKRWCYYKHNWNPSDNKGILWKPAFNQSGKSSRNTQISAYSWPTKIEWREYTNLYNTITSDEIKALQKRAMTSNEIEALLKCFLTKKSSGPNQFTTKFYQTCKEEQTSIVLKLFQELARKWKLTNSFFEASISCILGTKTQ
jgi:hypothetical protein